VLSALMCHAHHRASSRPKIELTSDHTGRHRERLSTPFSYKSQSGRSKATSPGKWAAKVGGKGNKATVKCGKARFGKGRQEYNVPSLTTSHGLSIPRSCGAANHGAGNQGPCVFLAFTSGPRGQRITNVYAAGNQSKHAGKATEQTRITAYGSGKMPSPHAPGEH
jgi:hypothetical protein